MSKPKPEHEHEHEVDEHTRLSDLAVKAAHTGYAEATIKPEPEPAVDFATLFHCASDETILWPKAVQAWAEKAPANQHVLDQIRGHTKGTPAGVAAPLVQTLINEVLKAVKG